MARGRKVSMRRMVSRTSPTSLTNARMRKHSNTTRSRATLVRIAILSPHRSRRGLKSREINKKKLISNLKSLGALDPSRIRLFVSMEFVHDGVFSVPSCTNSIVKKSKIREGSRCGSDLSFYRQFCIFISRLFSPRRERCGDKMAIRTSVASAHDTMTKQSGLV